MSPTSPRATARALLAAVGDVLRTVLRASDFAGRYGGEEFLMLLPDTDHEGGLDAAEKVREAVQSLDVAQVDGPITASLGVATLAMADGSPAPDGSPVTD